MDLIKDINIYQSSNEAQCYFKLFNRYISLISKKDVSMQYVERCVLYLNNLSNDIISTICRYSMDFCQDKMRLYPDIEYDNGLFDIVYEKDILNYVQPISLTIHKPESYDLIGFSLYCKCSWEHDNDMQILINNDQVVYLGVYEGLNPWMKNLSEWGNYTVGYHL